MILRNVGILPHLYTRKMEAAWFFEVLIPTTSLHPEDRGSMLQSFVPYHNTTRYHNPEGRDSSLIAGKTSNLSLSNCTFNSLLQLF